MKGKQDLGIDLGYLPPQNVELEAHILGLCLFDKEATVSVMQLLTAEMFYKDAHKAVFEAISGLFLAKMNVDILTVSESLKRAEKLDYVGGAYYLAEISGNVASGIHVTDWCLIVKECWIKRELIRSQTEGIRLAYSDNTDCFECFSYTNNALAVIGNKIEMGKNITWADVVAKAYTGIMEMMGKKNEDRNAIPGIPSYISSLDEITLGFQPGELIIIGARPSVGKSSIISYMMRKLAQDVIPVGFISAEMSSNSVAELMISAESEIDGYNLKSGRLSEGENQSLHNAIGRLEKLPINIDDASNMTIERLSIIARKWYNEQGIRILFVDYLQMLKTTTRQGTRDMELGVITKGLKNIAKDLNIPVVALCSLNRTNAKEKNPPTITDLRDSGNIESDADVVILLHRPEVYLDHESITDDVRGKMEADVCKNRNGKVGLGLIFMDKKTRSFRDWEKKDYEPQKSYTPLKPRTSSQDIKDDLPF